MATASIAKVLTALAVLHARPLAAGQPGPTLTIGAADVADYRRDRAAGGSVVPVRDGEQLTEYQALQALLLPSANNIAHTLARWAFGSTAGYLRAAAALAARLGLHSMRVTDPAGFAPTTVATPADLVVLGEAALRQPVLRRIVAEPAAVLPVAGAVHNVNALLGRDGIIGIKPGNTDADPGAFLFAATGRVAGVPLTVVGALTGAASLPAALAAAPPLIASTLANFTVLRPGTPLATYRLPWTGTVPAGLRGDAPVPVWPGTPVTITVSAGPLTTPAPGPGQVVGEVRIHDGSTGATWQLPLVLTGPAPGPGQGWRLRHLTRLRPDLAP